MIRFLDLGKQYDSIKLEIDDAISNVIADAAFIGGKYVNDFETQFSEFVGATECVGVGNGTDALEIAIEALDFPLGSEIIVPANSFIASSEAVTRCRHKVVFADVCNESYVLSVEDVKKRITPKTVAIIAVHLYGHPCDMDALEILAQENDLKIIEDCAQAHGAKYKGRSVGSIGDVAAFSFYPGKNLGAYGDGGAVTTNNKILAAQVRMISNHGRIDKYDHAFEGRNSRLDGLQAAILSVKLKYLDDWISRRIECADLYLDLLKDEAEVTLPHRSSWARQAYHLFVVRVDRRDELKQFLFDNEIETGIHYPKALPKLGAYTYLNKGDGQGFACVSDKTLLSLPIGEHLSKDEIVKVADKVKEFFSQAH